MSRADLHVHSTYSDGRLSPEELVDRAREAGIYTLALCDHDTVGGVGAARRQGEVRNVRVITGVELSVQVDPESESEGWVLEADEIHLLGYDIDIGSAAVTRLTAIARQYRRERIEEILNRLIQLGIHIDEEQIVGDSQHSGSMGRPHVAQALVAHGHCTDIAQAFSLYLGVGRPAFVPRKRPSARAAIEGIKQAGGKAVLAHPGLYRDPLERVTSLVDVGLDGVEVVHYAHSLAVSRTLAEMARRYGLVCTGGSDYHGYAEESPLGTVTIPESWADRLISK